MDDLGRLRTGTSQGHAFERLEEAGMTRAWRQGSKVSTE